MKRALTTLLSIPIFGFIAFSQGTYAENTVIGSLPSGLYYQTGPGASNVSGGYNWTYAYGTKLTINAGVSRNLEIMSINKNATGLVYRQWTEGASWTPWRTILSTNQNGRVGLGTSSPNAQMELYSTSSHALRLSTNAHNNNQKIEFTALGGTYHSIVSNTHTGNLQIRAGDGGSGHEVLFFTDGNGRAGVSSLGGLAVGNTYYSNNTAANRLIVEGDVGIGTTSPTEKLEVNGTVRSKKVRVEATGWPDYVFSRNYKLRTLNELEKYIKENEHLPDVPSAATIEKQGLDLGAMDATLLKKVEELTLYTIDQEKKLENQAARIRQQDAVIQNLLKRLEKLEQNKE